MATILAKVGPHIGVLIRFITYSVVAAVFFAGGILYIKLDASESTTEVVQADSEHSQEISDRTQELKDEVDEFLKYNDPYDVNGKPTPEWLRLMERQREIARSRGDQRSIVRKATNVFSP